MSDSGNTRFSRLRKSFRKSLRRRGISIVWLIVWLPVLMVLSSLVIDVANVWLARVELENGLEAAALAAVKDWAENSDNLQARQVGVAYAAFNKVRGKPIVIGPNHSAGGGLNENDACAITAGTPPTGNLIFGSVEGDDPVTFNAGAQPDCNATPPRPFAVRAQAQVAVPTLWASLLGDCVGPHCITVRTTAVYACPSGPPRLIAPDVYTCP